MKSANSPHQLIFSLLLMTFALSATYGQDVHFTQFYMQPLTVNPAQAGDFEGGFRASFINRRQWGQLGTPVETYGVGLEQKIWMNGDYLVLGGQFTNDRASQVGYVTTRGYFNSAYQRRISRHWLGVGIQVGMSRTTLDPDQTFPTQFNSSTGTFDNGLNNNEPTGILNRTFLDINVGFFWKTVYRERFRFKTGFSIAHVNKPNEAFTDNTARIPIRYLAHHSTEVILNREWSFISQSQAMYTGQAKEFITNALIKKKFSDVFSLTAGMGYRGYIINSDAALLLLGASYHYFDLGLSYDWNVSGLSANSTQKTSIEISIGVRTPERKRKPVLFKKRKPCPIYVDQT
ncbi:MAG: PorP/SprF family type IX secretion system membrane protein [Bacteroidota bacterium]